MAWFMWDRLTYLGALIPRAILVCLLTWSCTIDPVYKQNKAKLQFSTIAIVTPEDIVAIAVDGAESKSTRLGTGVGYGMAGGIVGGASVGALACGPYLYGICVIGMGMVGMIAGGTGGALYGFTGISEDDSLFIMEEMAHLSQKRDFQRELAIGVKSRLPDELVTTPEMADAQAITSVNSIEFVEQGKGAVYMKVSAILTIATQEDEGEFHEVKRNIHVKSKKTNIEEWLRVGSGKFENSVDDCLDELIAEMASVILQHSNFELSRL